jgi:hypothetical protein
MRENLTRTYRQQQNVKTVAAKTPQASSLTPPPADLGLLTKVQFLITPRV